jgi:hypothetical protein
LFRKRLRSLSGPEDCLGPLIVGGGACCWGGEQSGDGVETGVFGATAEFERKWMDRRRTVKPSLEVMVGCSNVGELGWEGLPLGFKREGVLEGRFEGACSDFRRVVEEDCGRCSKGDVDRSLSDGDGS